MEPSTVVLLGVAASLALSAVLSGVILPPTRAVLRRVCQAEDAVSFWTRFTILMLFLGPLIVTLIFGIPYSDLSSRFSTTDLVVRVVSSCLVGAFLTLGGIGLRIGTLRRNAPAAAPAATRSDDAYMR